MKYSRFILNEVVRYLTLFKMDLFGAAHGWGAGKKTPFLNICHTYPTMMKLSTVIPYIKKIQKTYESRDTPLEFSWHQHFLTGNQLPLLYQGIQIKIAFWYIIFNSFNFFRVFKGCFNKHGCNFVEVSKIGYSRPT